MDEKPVTKADVEYLISRVEWGYNGMCPVCRNYEREGHNSMGCAVASFKERLAKNGLAAA